MWAPAAATVDVHLEGDGRSPVALEPDAAAGTWLGVVDGAGHADRYRFSLDGAEPLPDPASRWQPDGVHGPSAVVDPATFSWTDGAWPGLRLADTVLYELHVGTFTPEGTLDAAIGQLARLAALGVTAVELMPVNAFPGARNWGYDGVFVSAVQHSYGGPEALARLVDAAHAAGIGVVLDVVYNHLGPEGNVLDQYGPYVTETYATPWGGAVNVAEAGSDLVRRTFAESACGWVEHFHVDGLRLDAVGFIHDPTAKPFLEELTAAVHAAADRAGRSVIVTAESADNDPRLITPAADGGIGCDASWNDDLHHSLRVALTGERRGYYADYRGVEDVAEALATGWVFNGRYSPYRGRRHGRPLDLDRTGHRPLVVYSGTHDQVGNTPGGERPRFEHGQRLLAAATVLLSPYTPMLFMGEEYGETAPFPYFVDHGDPELLEATRQGRLHEFSGVGWEGEVADPADPATYQRAILDPSLASTEPHRSLLAAHTELIAVRRRHPVLTDPAADHRVARTGDTVVTERNLGSARSVLTMHFGNGCAAPDVEDRTTVVFDSGEARWWGERTPQRAWSCLLAIEAQPAG